MKTQVFIGGWENSGTRIIVDLLRPKGYDPLITHSNQVHDYKHNKMTHILKDILENETNVKYLIESIKFDTKGKDIWVIKHGYLMVLIPYLKQTFPDSVFILCIRHPLDQLIKPSHNYKTFGKLNSIDPSMIEKFRLYKEWHDKALLHTDYIIRLEDLLFNKEETIVKLYEFLKIEDTSVNEKILAIVKPPSDNVGRYKEIEEYIIKFGY